MRTVASLVLVLLLSPATAAAGESSLRCDRGIVALGDSKVDLLAKCGEPSLRDGQEVERRMLAVPGQPPMSTVLVLVEQWTYNHGPQRFMDLVTLEGGKVTAIERGGYGYDPARVATPRSPGRATCEPSQVQVGLAKLDLLVRCGEPVAKDAAVESRVLPPAVEGAPAGAAQVLVEVWTFDFGPQRFMQIATLENGKVVSVRRGGYGYAR